jgi:probable blue pigment (indigoidine) exporter
MEQVAVTLTDQRKGYVSAFISYTSVAFGFIGMTYMIQSSSVLGAQALFFFMGALLSLGLLYLSRGEIRLHSLRQNWRTYSLTCLLMVYVATTTFVCIGMIGPGPVSFVGQMGIVFGILLGAAFLGEKIRIADGLGALIAIVGVSCMTYSPVEYMKLGVLLVLGSSLALALHNLIIKQHSSEIDKVELLLLRAVTTFVAVGLLAALSGQVRQPPMWLVPIGALTALFGFMAVNFFRYTALGFIEMSKVSMLRVIAPVGVMALSFLVFKIVPGTVQLIGSGLILAGVSMIVFQPLFHPSVRSGIGDEATEI